MTKKGIVTFNNYEFRSPADLETLLQGKPTEDTEIVLFLAMSGMDWKGLTYRLAPQSVEYYRLLRAHVDTHKAVLDQKEKNREHRLGSTLTEACACYSLEYIRDLRQFVSSERIVPFGGLGRKSWTYFNTMLIKHDLMPMLPHGPESNW